MAKVKCKFCKFENNAKCIRKKKTTIKLNKNRRCSKYELDNDKFELFVQRKASTPSPKITLRPDWYWDKTKRPVEIKKDFSNPLDGFNSKYPLTGDLSRFATTAV